MTDTLHLDTLPFYLWEAASTVDAQEGYVGVAMIDSVFDTRPADSLRQHPSLFLQHTLAVRHDSLQARSVNTPPIWIFSFLTILTAMLCLYFRLHKLHVGTLLTSTVDSRAMDRMLRGNNMTRTSQLLPMGLLMVATLALPLHSLTLDGIGNYLLLTVGLATAYLIRNILIRLLGIIFDNSAAVGIYITSNYIYHLVLASLLTPLLFLYYYLPGAHNTLLFILEIIVITEFVIRLFRGMKLFLTQSSESTIYLFYYLCTVEIVPILVLIKYL